MSSGAREPSQSHNPKDADEAARLAALQRYAILDTGREPAFDEIVELAAGLLDAPVALVNFIATGRQWFKAERGLGMREMPLGASTQREVLLQPGVTIVPDMRGDERFRAHPPYGDMRFYAGASLQTAEGLPLGTVCVLAPEPRPAGLAPMQERVLRALAAQVMAQLELRLAAATAREDASRFCALFEQSAVGTLHLDLSGCWTRVNRRLAGMLGYDAPSDLVGRTCFDLTHPDDQEADRPLLRRLGAGEISFYRRAKRYLRRDGTPIPVKVTVSLIRDDAGAPAHCSAIVEDLTDRHAAEAALAAVARDNAFLLDVETRLRDIAEGAAIADAGAAAIGLHLGVAQVGLADMASATTHAVIRRDWNDGRVTSVAGTWPMMDFAPELMASIRAGHTVAIADISEDPRTSLPRVLEAYAAIGTRSLLVVPLLRGGVFAASLFIHHPEPRPWAAHEISAVEKAAACIWAAMDRARAEAMEAEHAQLLGMIAGGEPLAACLAALTDAVTRLEPSTRAAVLIADAGRTMFESTVAVHISPAFGASIAGAMIEEMAIGTCGTAVHRGEPVLCPDIATEGDWAPEWRALCLAHGLRAVYSEPVMGTEGKAVASLALYLDAARQPTGRERQVARFAARLAALAIGRDRADRELRVRAAHHGLLFHLLDVLRRTDDVATIMQAAAVAIGEQLGADRANFVTSGGPGIMAFRAGWSGGSLPPLTGTWPVSALGSHVAVEARAGRTYSFADAARDPLTQGSRFGEIGVAAGIGAPILRDGAWQAGLWVNSATPRAWTADETKLVREVAELCWDAVERAQVEAALRESEARLRLATEAAEIAFWDVDVANNALVWPPRMKAMFGISPEVPVSRKDFLDGLHPEDREATAAVYEAAADPARRALYDVEYRAIGREDGMLRWVAAKGRGVFDAEGHCLHVLGTAVDITARRQAEQALADSQRELQQINASLEARIHDEVAAREAAQAQLAHAQRMEALGQLAGGIAHDFNNVLQAVQGGARLIQSRAGDAERTRYVAGMIADAAERGASVTRRLLAFSRRGDLRAEPVNPAGLLADLRDILAHTLGAGIHIRVQVPAGLPPLLADKGQLETVLVNLAANARDAMGGAGAVTLAAALDTADTARPRALRPGAYLRISVSDTGGGMDAATLARASEPFFTTKPPGQGTGLGLAMARGFAEQSHGALEIESAPGRGTTIRLWFPVAEGEVVEADAAWEVTVAPNGSPRLLLVDDEPLVREITAQALEAGGFAVLSVGSGAEALKLLHAAEPVDLLISDLSMPGIDGLKLIEAAQRLRPRLPAILLTGFATDAAALAMGGAISGSFSLLRKPIEPQMLCERAAALVKGATSST